MPFVRAGNAAAHRLAFGRGEPRPRIDHLLVFDPDSRLLVDADIAWAIGPATSAAFRVLKRAPRFGQLTTSWFPLQSKTPSRLP